MIIGLVCTGNSAAGFSKSKSSSLSSAQRTKKRMKHIMHVHTCTIPHNNFTFTRHNSN